MATASEQKILADLRRPFTPAAVKFKVQAVQKNGKYLIVAYIDARLTSARLNLSVGFDWEDRYEEIPGGLRCYLTVMGHTRCDVGEPGDSAQGKKPKALHSDAFKRAGVRFGIGESLYAVPNMRLDPSDMNGNYISPEGMRKLRDGYARWLKSDANTFGEPLDHGDVEDAAGDLEVAERENAIALRGASSLTPVPASVEPNNATAAAPVEHPPAPVDARSPKEMAVDAFKAWVPTGQSKAAKDERETIKLTLAALLGHWKRDADTGVVITNADGEPLEPDVSSLPGTLGGIGNALYGLIGEAIQSREECAAALAAADEGRLA